MYECLKCHEKIAEDKIAIAKTTEPKETDIHVTTTVYSRVDEMVTCPYCKTRTYFH